VFRQNFPRRLSSWSVPQKKWSAHNADYLKDFNETASQNGKIEVLPIRYHDILKDPEAVAREVATFAMQQADINAMVKAVEPKLYRTKTSKVS
jgi:hypothetical protein